MKEELLKVLVEGSLKGLGNILIEAGKIFSDYRMEEKNDHSLPQRKEDNPCSSKPRKPELTPEELRYLED